MKVLITGARGFIGSNLYLTLKQIDGIEVLPYDLGDEAKLDEYTAGIYVKGPEETVSPEKVKP